MVSDPIQTVVASMLQPRQRRLEPADPSADSFIDRLGPFSSDPVGDMIKKELLRGRGDPVRPGTQERFGDPSKVIAMRTNPEESDQDSYPPGPINPGDAGIEQMLLTSPNREEYNRVLPNIPSGMSPQDYIRKLIEQSQSEKPQP